MIAYLVLAGFEISWMAREALRAEIALFIVLSAIGLLLALAIVFRISLPPILPAIADLLKPITPAFE